MDDIVSFALGDFVGAVIFFILLYYLAELVQREAATRLPHGAARFLVVVGAGVLYGFSFFLIPRIVIWLVDFFWGVFSLPQLGVWINLKNWVLYQHPGVVFLIAIVLGVNYAFRHQK